MMTQSILKSRCCKARTYYKTQLVKKRLVQLNRVFICMCCGSICKTLNQ